ncbi:hypothetical protein RIF29_10780 [Crotalaria pallida]|uniref:Uncharacterized protein n=1 Tax=Crotalaria pallida TaxID=3830 RepID=A0AAN9G0A9_CROPI
MLNLKTLMLHQQLLLLLTTTPIWVLFCFRVSYFRFRRTVSATLSFSLYALSLMHRLILEFTEVVRD